jgi:hypothetical protein
VNEPEAILPQNTRVQTCSMLLSTGGWFVREKHLEVRKPDAIGVICGVVGGHGGDVYWVDHIGDPCMAAYGWREFNLAPAQDPCPVCKEGGFDWVASHAKNIGTACSACGGTAEKAG